MSSTYFSAGLLRKAEECVLPMLIGVNSLEDCKRAVSCGARWLKVYPVGSMSQAELDEIVCFLHFYQQSIPVQFGLSGGITSANCDHYVSLQADQLLVGLDLCKIGIDEAALTLQHLDKQHANQVNNEVNDSCMLQSQ